MVCVLSDRVKEEHALLGMFCSLGSDKKERDFLAIYVLSNRLNKTTVFENDIYFRPVKTERDVTTILGIFS